MGADCRFDVEMNDMDKQSNVLMFFLISNAFILHKSGNKAFLLASEGR